MFITLFTILCIIQMLTQECICLNLVDLPLPGNQSDKIDYNDAPAPTKQESDAPGKYKPDAPASVNYAPVIIAKYNELPTKITTQKSERRYWLIHDDTNDNNKPIQRVYEDEKDVNLKNKISALIDQTMQDTAHRMKLVQDLKEKHRAKEPYKAGFILCLVKKSKDVIDELFNVAVRHRHQWMSLEHLKVFELIMHTNVDTTNLLRQLVDVHVNHLNANNSDKKRLILI